MIQGQSGPWRGVFSWQDLPRLFHTLHLERRTGKLELVSGSMHKTLYWHHGYPVWVASALQSETLGEYLVNQGLITRDMNYQALQVMERTGKRQGEVLVELGAITTHDLYKALSEHLKNKIVNCFSWSQGEFTFTDQGEIPADLLMVKLEPARLVLEGILRFYDRFEATLDPPDPQRTRTVPSKGSVYSLDQLALGADEHRIFQLAMSGKTVSAIESQIGSERKVVRFLHAMKSLGFIDFAALSEAEALQAARSTKPPEPATPTPHRPSTAPQALRPSTVPQAHRPSQVPVPPPAQDHEKKEAEEHFDLGKRYMDSRDYVLASKAFAQAAEQDPQRADFQAYLGWSLFLSDMDSKAGEGAALVRKAFALDPGSRTAKVLIECIHKLQGTPDEVEQGFKLALSLNPHSRYPVLEIESLKHRRRKT